MSIFYIYSGGDGSPGYGTTDRNDPTQADNWSNAFRSLVEAFSTITPAAGDILYVADDHVAGYGGSTTLSFPNASPLPVYVRCVNRTTGLPSTGARENTTTSNPLAIDGNLHSYGVTYEAGSGTNAVSISVGSSSGDAIQVYENCVLFLAGGSTSSNFYVGGTAANSATQKEITLQNTQVRLSHAGQGISARCRLTILGGGLHASTVAPTSVFKASSAPCSVESVGSDWSNATNLVDVDDDDTQTHYRFRGCLRPTNYTTGTHPGQGASIVEAYCCGAASSDDNNWNSYRRDASGVMLATAAVYPDVGPAVTTDTGGETIKLSYELTDDATNINKANPLWTPWIPIFVAGTGSKTISVKCADSETNALKDGDLFLEVAYMGGAAATDTAQLAAEGTFPVISGTQSFDVLAAGSDLTDTNEAWTGITETHTYTLSKTVTVDEQGYLLVRVGLGVATTNAVYASAKVGVA